MYYVVTKELKGYRRACSCGFDTIEEAKEWRDKHVSDGLISTRIPRYIGSGWYHLCSEDFPEPEVQAAVREAEAE